MPTQQEIEAQKAGTPSFPYKNQGVNDPAETYSVNTQGQIGKGPLKTGSVGTGGAYNPYTKGYEAVNSGVGVNQGQYSAQAKLDLAKSYGYQPGQVKMGDFERKQDGSLGIKLPKLAQVGSTQANAGTQASGAAPAVTGTVPVPPVNAPVGDVQISGPVKTGIATVDEQNQKDYDAKQKAIKDAEGSYIANKATYEQNKGYYSNYDATKGTFDNVMNDRRAALGTSPDGSLTDQQAQAIANKYGVTVDEVRNPNKVWDKLLPTEEGKQKLGITGAQSQLDQMTTRYAQARQDAAANLKTSLETGTQQIEDAKKQLQRNLDFMKASGALSGAYMSSGWLQGLDNAQKDGQATIDKLGKMLETAKSDDAQHVQRLTQEYTTAMTGAKADFDQKMSAMKQEAGTSMSAIAEQYGIGSDELTKALQAIEDNFHHKTEANFKDYLDNVKTIQSLTDSAYKSAREGADATFKKQEGHYSAYLDNNGAAMANTSFQAIAADVAAGTLSPEHAELMKATMLSSVQATLQANGATITPDEQNTIEHMLTAGKTPAQVVSAMQSIEKFKPKTPTAATDIRTDKAGNTYKLNPATNKYELVIPAYPASGAAGASPVSAGEFTENMALTRPAGSTNVGNDTNNPGNITADSIPSGETVAGYGEKIGAIGTYRSPNGREYFVFPSADAGTAAMARDIASKQSGDTQSAILRNPNATLGDFLRVWSGSDKAKTSYAAAVMQVTGADMKTPFRSIDPSMLAKGVAKAEGFSGSAIAQPSAGAPSANSAGTTITGKSKYTPSQIQTLDAILNSDTVRTPAQDEAMAKAGLTDADISTREDEIIDAEGGEDGLAKQLANYMMAPTEISRLQTKNPDKWERVRNGANKILKSR
jgi:hypothetical protein